MKKVITDVKKTTISVLKTLFICFSILTLSACSKEDDKPGNPSGETFFIATIDGKETRFEASFFARRTGKQSISITGNSETIEEHGEIFSLTLFGKGEDIKAQTYTLDSGPYSLLNTYSLVTYKDDKISSQEDYTASTDSAAPGDDFTIKIIGIDEQYVKGVFAGKVVIQNGSTTVASVNITDGKFSVPFR